MSIGGLRGTKARFSELVIEWTPMILTVTYCLGSFFIYPMMPAIAHEVIWYVLVALQTLTAISVSTEAMQAIRPSIRARRDRRYVEKNGWQLEKDQEWPLIDVVLVAYLPNEQDIIMRQVRYALTKIDYPTDRITINVVYNTPKPIPHVEQQLFDLENHHSNVRIFSVPNSTSKAHNINYFLTQPSRGQIITIYDTDHFADPMALRWVAKRFLTGEVDIIQGRCCIYNHSETWLTAMVGVEFDMIYGVAHSGRAEIQRYGFFGGSNGHWNASLLRAIGMQGHMLTEDIDSSIRAIISGARIEYDLRVMSYEQAPETLAAFTKQRLRWTQGWTQVAIRHIFPAVRRGAYSDSNGWRSRVGLAQLLLYREIYFYINTQLCWLLASAICTNVFTKGINSFFHDFGGFALAMWALAINLICLFVTICIVMRNRSHFTKPISVILFAFLTVFYYTYVAHMAIYGHFRQLVRYGKWNPTARSK